MTATVIAADITSKAAAVATLGDGSIQLAGNLFLGVVHNTNFALGYSLGGSSVLASALVSAVIVLLVIRVCEPLTEIHRGAPLMLGLVTGAAIANPGSLLLGTAGVVDYIGIQHGTGAIVFNLADVAAYLGVALAMPVVWSLAARLRMERQATVAAARTVMPARSGADFEVPVPIFAERADAARSPVDRGIVPTDSRERLMELPPPVRPDAELRPYLDDRR